MADQTKRKRGRPGVSDSEKKRRKLFRNKDYQQSRVFLGSEKPRWDKIKLDQCFKTDREVATFLIDRYKHSNQDTSTEKQDKEGTSKSSLATPVRAVSTPMNIVPGASISTPSVSGISEPESERDAKLSGVDRLQSSEESTSEKETILLPESRPRVSKKLSSSFVDPFEISIDVTILESEEDDDPDYEPSIIISSALPDHIHMSSEDVAFEEAEFGLERDDEQNVDEKEEESEDEITYNGVTRIRTDDHCEAVCKDIKCVVFLTQLKLLTRLSTTECPTCRTTHIQLHESFIGSALYFKWVCKDGHMVERWCSQPVLNRQVHSGDFMICSTILTSGNNYSKMNLWASMCHIKFPSADQFHKIQTTYLVPTIDEYWEDHQRDLLTQFDNCDVKVLGDGRNDSPGHCAQYCSYTLMEIESKKILTLKTIDKRVTDRKSAAMEKLGFQSAIDELATKGVTVKEVVTDGHLGIKSLMKSTYPDIKHSHDIWHVAKNLGKKITKVAQKKGNSVLHQWNRDIINHFWFACKEAQSYAQFVGIWCSVMHHIVNEHEWILPISDEGSAHCLHGPLTDKERNKPWLDAKTNSQTLQALATVVFDKRLLGNVGYYLNFRSTADLEGFNQHILMYAAKRFSYTPPIYRVRNLLAAIDHNKHADRPNCLNKDGSLRLQRVWNKKSARWSVYPVKVKKSYDYMDRLITNALVRRINDKVGMYRPKELKTDDPRKLSKQLAPIPPRPTADIFAEQKSRFK